MYRSLEPSVSLLHIEGQLPDLLLTQLLRRPHLVQRDEPLDDLAAMVKVALGDLVDGLDHVAEQRVQGLFGGHVELERVEEGDEILGRVDDQTGAGGGRPGGAPGRRVAGIVGRLLDRGGHADPNALHCTRTFNLHPSRTGVFLKVSVSRPPTLYRTVPQPPRIHRPPNLAGTKSMEMDRSTDCK